MTAIRPLVAGNWKMNGLSPSLAELRALKAHVKKARPLRRPDGVPARNPACPRE